MTQYGTGSSGPYDEGPACQHEWQRYSDGVFCRKCYKPNAETAKAVAYPEAGRRLMTVGADFGAAVLRALGIDPNVTQATAFDLHVQVGGVPRIRLECYIDIQGGEQIIKTFEAVEWKQVAE